MDRIDQGIFDILFNPLSYNFLSHYTMFNKSLYKQF